MGAMPAKSKKKGNNRALEEETAPTTSVVTRANDTKDNEDVALALAKSQLDQLNRQDEIALDEKILNMTLRHSFSDVPVTPHMFVRAGGKTYVSSAAYVRPDPTLDLFPLPLPMLPPRKPCKLVVLGFANSKKKLSLVVGEESVKSSLKWVKVPFLSPNVTNLLLVLLLMF